MFNITIVKQNLFILFLFKTYFYFHEIFFLQIKSIYFYSTSQILIFNQNKSYTNIVKIQICLSYINIYNTFLIILFILEFSR